MSEPKRIEVSCCALCPFADQGTDPWRCERVRDDLPREGYFGNPPRWCPLRDVDHVVTLRLK